MNFVFILATRNLSKAEQIRLLINDPRITVKTLDEVGIVGEGVEDGTTLEQNAMKKAQYAFDRRPDEKQWVVAEDTGFFIEALGGLPGIRAARWAGEFATTAEITEFTLDKMRTKTNRSATFQTVAILMNPDGEVGIFKGECSGQILLAEKVLAQPMMPYSRVILTKTGLKSGFASVLHKESLVKSS